MRNKVVKAFMLVALVLGLLVGPRVASRAASFDGGGLATPSALVGGGSSSH